MRHSKRNRTPAVSGAILTLAAVAALTPSGLAEEGGAGHYLPGGSATMADLAPDKAGWVVESMYLNYRGDGSRSRTFPVAGLIAGDLRATSDAFILGGLFTFEKKVLGAKYSLGGFMSYVWMDVEASLTLNGNTRTVRDRVDGFGDLTLIPAMMSWKLNDNWKLNAQLPVYAPTGDYEVGRLANAGLNHWTIDPMFGTAYANAKIGFNFTAFAGFALSTENPDTNYQNGTVFHIDASVQQLLPLGPGFVGLGVEGFYLEQITGDRGSGATLGDFKGMTTGVGPVLSYILPVKDNTFVAEVRWLKELDTTRRLKGEYIWLKLIYQF